MGRVMDFSGINGFDYSKYIEDANNSAAEALKNKLNNASQAGAADDELMDACKQFEAYLWEQVFKEMEKTVKVFSSDEDSDEYASNMVDYFKDSFIQEVSGQAASQSSNSLARMLYEQMKRTYNV